MTSSIISLVSKSYWKTETFKLNPHSSLQRSITSAHDIWRSQPVGIRLSCNADLGQSPTSRLSRSSPCAQPSCDMHQHWWQAFSCLYNGRSQGNLSSYATFFEAGMVATDNTHHHSTYSRTSFLEHNKASITLTIQSTRTVTASPQSSISWSHGQSIYILI